MESIETLVYFSVGAFFFVLGWFIRGRIEQEVTGSSAVNVDSPGIETCTEITRNMLPPVDVSSMPPMPHNTKPPLVEAETLDKQKVIEYLDDCVSHWRGENKTEELRAMAPYYIDAFLSAKVTLQTEDDLQWATRISRP